MTRPDNTNGENWLTLMEYAMKNGVSLSTLRRQIKSQKVKFIREEGRYLVLDEQAGKPPQSAEVGTLRNEVTVLKHNLTKAQVEITELKTLIALYEEQIQIPNHP